MKTLSSILTDRIRDIGLPDSLTEVSKTYELIFQLVEAKELHQFSFDPIDITTCHWRQFLQAVRGTRTWRDELPSWNYAVYRLNVFLRQTRPEEAQRLMRGLAQAYI